MLLGELTMFTVLCDSGRTKECAFCGRCGTRIYHRGEWGLSIKAGTLDDTSSLSPDAHYWTKSKQDWTPLPADIPCFKDLE